MRLVIVLLLLVVLPTAILSLVAGRSIQSREIILYQRLEQNAALQIEKISLDLDQLMQSDSELVISAFRETVLSGKHNDRMLEKVNYLRSNSNFIKDVYLFMNPWNFIFPREISQSPERAVSANLLLKQELIKQISISLKRVASNIAFSYEGAAYCFKPVPDMPELYAGLEIDMERVLAKLDVILADHSNGDIILRIVAIDSESTSSLQSDILITDSFNPQPSAINRFGSGNVNSGNVLVTGRLRSPLMHVEISDFLVDEAGISKAQVLELRLIKWGILLLAIVIITSSVILIRNTMNQAVVAKKRSEFVIGMSHDLRTPVAAMRVLADSLSSGRVESPEKQKKFLTTISSECERLGDMIERVLFFFKQEHGAVTYTMQPLDIGEMVKRVVDSVVARSAGKMIVELEISDDLPRVKGDFDALEKVVTNLLDNALKYGGSFGSGAPPWPARNATLARASEHSVAGGLLMPQHSTY